MKIESLTRYIGLEAPQGQLHERDRFLEELQVEAVPYDHLYDGQPSYGHADLHNVQPATVAMRGEGTQVGGHTRVPIRIGTLAITSFVVQATGGLGVSVKGADARLYHRLLDVEGA